MARPPGRRLRRRQQRDAVPVAVGQPRLGCCGWRGSASEGQGRLAGRTPRGVVAGGDRLVGPSPPGPAEPEGLLLRSVAQREDQPAPLRHRERDQTGIGALFSPPSSCRAAWRRTIR